MTLTDKQKTRLNYLLSKLKEAHKVFLIANEEQKGKLIDSCQWAIKELCEFGRDESFYTLLLMYGEEFLIAEFGDPEEKILGGFKQEQSESEKKESDLMESIGAMAWEKTSSGKLIVHIWKPSPTMEILRARSAWMKSNPDGFPAKANA